MSDYARYLYEHSTKGKTENVLVVLVMVVGFGEIIMALLSTRIKLFENIVFSKINISIVALGITLLILYGLFRVLLTIKQSLTKNAKSSSFLLRLFPPKEFKKLLEAINNYQNGLDEFYQNSNYSFDVMLLYTTSKHKMIKLLIQDIKYYSSTLKNEDISIEILLNRFVFVFFVEEIRYHSNWSYEKKACEMIYEYALEKLLKCNDITEENRNAFLANKDKIKFLH